MFSVDYPFEKTELATQFMDQARISETERAQVLAGNARHNLRLQSAT